MAALRTDALGTPILAAETLVERLEALGRSDVLAPETHLAILHRLGMMETGLRGLQSHAPETFPEDAVADLGCAVALQAAVAKFGSLDRITFERSILRMRHALHQLRLWSAGARAFPAQRVVFAPVRRVGRFTVYEGGRL